MQATQSPQAPSSIFIVASAYGVDFVQKQGHAAVLPLAANAGADGLEVRRELFLDSDAEIALQLAGLKSIFDAHGLQAMYSAPESLFRPGGDLDLALLASRLHEAEVLGAATLKLQMHGYAGRVDAPALQRALSRSPATLLLENGQQESGCRISEFAGFFAACSASFPAIPVAMTFDIGNWSWAGEDPVAAVQALAPHVRYIHCKDVQGSGMRRFAVALDEGSVDWRACLSRLPGAVPRAIEYPLPADPAAQARHVRQLRAAAASLSCGAGTCQ
ncbi:sugar phosphate isomerase/epimerase family protein [Collimonas humicola]|uniref:sugar phosphate isomerase/epimerase family protein n=1 Tax=Collimonas humicola TaxID=2825886 RepID=UPI001B8B07AD|nr:sugar phosphate isomerase/epimerase [Collimonas humicola]